MRPDYSIGAREIRCLSSNHSFVGIEALAFAASRFGASGSAESSQKIAVKNKA
jgi:hypothetical protein